MAKKILVVGGGGREHAIIKALKKSPDCGEIWCAPGNGGISYDAKCKNIKATDVDTMVGFAVEEKFDYVVVAQDDPLALGMVDALAKVGIPAFGPDKAAARIEASKVFSKDLMKKYGIPTAKYETFDDPAKVMDYIRAEGKYPVVIKADGLALGKGVLICENEQQAADGVKEIMLDKKFGASGNHVVVEEFLTGPEVSVLSFTDGKVVKPMVSSMDHKRANDHDTGLNTGGMGTIAPNPYYTPEVAAECMEKIFLPTIHAMNAEGCPFKGCLYFGLMLTPDGPKVIEYNCRFGDPETQVVLPLLEGDLLHIMQACTNGTLDLGDPNEYGGVIRVTNKKGEISEIHTTHAYVDGNFRGLGVADAAYAIRNGRPARCSGEMNRHVLEMALGILESSATGQVHLMQTTCQRPQPFAPGYTERPELVMNV